MMAEVPQKWVEKAANALAAYLATHVVWPEGHHGVARAVLAAVLPDVPRVEIEKQNGAPTTCKVWRNGVLVFDGVDRSALLEVGERREG